MKQKSILIIVTAISFLLLGVFAGQAQTTAFTYQGRLTNNSAAANGNFDMQFRLFDTPNAGTGAQQGSTITNPTVPVTNGIFAVNLDFGAVVFNGAARYLEVSIRPSGNSGGYTSLAPRQAITSAPYAVQSLKAAAADAATNATNAGQLGGVAADQYVMTADPRLKDPRQPLPGSNNYIQNSTGQQTETNFNISGNGIIGGIASANIINAQTQYNIGGNRILSINAGFDSIFAGYSAGATNTGSNNSFFGMLAGAQNTTGSFNTFFGSNAGLRNQTGSGNSFYGVGAGFFNSGGGNSFFGDSAGDNNQAGSNNTLIGAYADVSSGDLTYATAIGAGAVVSTSNTIALGRSNGSDKVRVFGLGAAGTDYLCRNGNNEISTCSSSLRYKTNIAPFDFGFNLINQLKPITFNWTQGGTTDVGFGAEEVARINPLFVSYNKDGQVEGVKYDRLSVAFVNAFKEQQKQIDEQKRYIEEQKNLITALKALVCQQNQQAEVCREK